MNIIKIIAGLSNPFKKYNNTRHNIGALFVKNLSKKFNIKLNIKNKFLGNIGIWKYNNQNIYLFVPSLYMNLNGISIRLISSFYNISYKNILIVQDDIYTNVGISRFVVSNNHYGHNGIKNIIYNFNKKCLLNRLCIGIGKPTNKHNLASYVLSEPLKEEKKLINKSINESINIVKNLIKKNISIKKI
ncbi:aminoacyl-tRNA hydrolase [Buchnera aphidicola (Ceratoglyphina bambusae)]|uniref:aminoacyl-tRNA hydrolase n=1 Tax=Buchnera aphidicola TaxID=9 RepID=UPI0031B7EC44